MKNFTEEQFNAISGQITNMEAVEPQKAAMRPLLDEVRRFIPDAAYNYRMDDETRFHDIQIRFVRNGINLQIYKFNKHYCIGSDLSAFEHVETRYGWPAAENGYKTPNNMSVMSARKVAERIEYEIAKYRYFEQLNTAHKQQIDEFLKAAEGEPIRWRYKNVGLIERNGVVLNFDFSTGAIHTHIEIANPYSVSVEVFKKLADSRLFDTK